MNEVDAQSLIEQYKEAAMRHGNAKSARAANAAAEKLATIYRALREQDMRAMLLPLLESPDPSVQSWAASHALEFEPDAALPVLERLAGGPPGAVRADASMTLEEWRAGRLAFP
ncbi:HEAT repeat domain-containing protein [Haliangium sp.]|uniref:HEAT repeat domain-containing protein n=1 Tax=Haliangium sp. TaxID=2663208 RepID=UPI003D104AFB